MLYNEICEKGEGFHVINFVFLHPHVDVRGNKFCSTNRQTFNIYVSRGMLSAFRGLETEMTSVFLKQNFALHKYTLAHAIGHMIGCAHQSFQIEEGILIV